MAYQIEPKTGDIIINGFENGIGDSQYKGLGNVININNNSVPGEAPVNFSTALTSPPIISNGSVTSANTGTEYFTYTGATGLENYMTIVFTVHSGLNVTNNIPYWIINLNGAGAGTFQLTTDYLQSSILNVTSSGTGTFKVATVGLDPITGTVSIPKFFSNDTFMGTTYMLTSTGALWSNVFVTDSGYWTYTGTSGTTVGLDQGAGLGYYQAFNAYNTYMFVFRNTTIDYLIIRQNGNAIYTWVFGWDPTDGTIGHTFATLNTNTSIHNVYYAQNNTLYWCDGGFIGSIHEIIDPAPQMTKFEATDPATYIYAKEALIVPYQDSSQCLAELGTNLLVGGERNAIYPWNRNSTSFTYPILLAESDIKNIVTVNTSSYIFVGNRGRIWVTNGSQANIFKKIPDFISGTIEPYFGWGGACSTKNQLYFSFTFFKNDANLTTLTTSGGLWAIDIPTKAIRLANTLSYQTTIYNGYAPCLIPSSAKGEGLYIGWYNTSNQITGIDQTISAPYSGTSAVSVGIIESDLIPMGTVLKPTTNGRVEFKLAIPLVANESIKIQYRQKFSDSFTDISTTTLFNTTGTYSGAYQSVNFQNSQWIQLRAVMISAISSPSYIPLTELRIGS